MIDGSHDVEIDSKASWCSRILDCKALRKRPWSSPARRAGRSQLLGTAIRAIWYVVCWEDWDFFLGSGCGAGTGRAEALGQGQGGFEDVRSREAGSKRGLQVRGLPGRGLRTRSRAEEPEAIRQLVVHDFEPDRLAHPHDLMTQKHRFEIPLFVSV